MYTDKLMKYMNIVTNKFWDLKTIIQVLGSSNFELINQIKMNSWTRMQNVNYFNF